MAKHKDDFKDRFKVSVSTARSQLMKKLLFEFAQKLGKDNCHCCGEKIDLASFSIEHVKPWAWEDNAYELFMDTSNISFSHTKCNSGNTRFTERVKAALTARKDRRVKGEQLQCSGCETTKDKSEFHKNKTTPTGHESLCKPCRKIKRSKV